MTSCQAPAWRATVVIAVQKKCIYIHLANGNRDPTHCPNAGFSDKIHNGKHMQVFSKRVEFETLWESAEWPDCDAALRCPPSLLASGSCALCNTSKFAR
jgi:hypothetical protein